MMSCQRRSRGHQCHRPGPAALRSSTQALGEPVMQEQRGSASLAGYQVGPWNIAPCGSWQRRGTHSQHGAQPQAQVEWLHAT